jgi:hypothetical protein
VWRLVCTHLHLHACALIHREDPGRGFVRTRLDPLVKPWVKDPRTYQFHFLDGTISNALMTAHAHARELNALREYILAHQGQQAGRVDTFFFSAR